MYRRWALGDISDFGCGTAASLRQRAVPNLAPLPIARLGLLHTPGNVPEVIVQARHTSRSEVKVVESETVDKDAQRCRPALPR